MNHDEVIARIGQLADDHGLLWVYYPRTVQLRGHRGAPDLLLAGRGGIAFAEIKTGTQLEPAQLAWRDMLRAAGAWWHLWQPGNLWDGSIGQELQRLARPRP
jgi:hypothetical protein